MQCQTALPMPPTSDLSPHTPTGFLQQYLTIGLENAKAFLTITYNTKDNYHLTDTTLKPSPNGSHIIPHQKKQNSATLTNFTISMADALLATLEDPTRPNFIPLFALEVLQTRKPCTYRSTPTPTTYMATHITTYLQPAALLTNLAPHMTISKYTMERGMADAG